MVRRTSGAPAVAGSVDGFVPDPLEWEDCGSGTECATLAVPLDWADVANHLRAAVRSETVALVRIAELNGLIDPLFDLALKLDRADQVLDAQSM